MNIQIELIMKNGEIEALPESEIKPIIEEIIGGLREEIVNDPEGDEIRTIFRELSSDVDGCVIRVTR